MITPATATTTQNTTTSTSTADKTNALSSDFETFLKMLTVQMQNQDPLNPIESEDYAVQLATFSGVEQQVKTNDLLQGLSKALGGGLSEMTGWIGKEVPAPGKAQFTGAPLTLNVEAYPGSVRQVVEVQDTGGTVLQRLVVTESGQIQWDGLGDNGAPLGPGRYQFSTVSIDAEGKEHRAATQVYQAVTEVRSTPKGMELVLSSGETMLASGATALRDPRL